MEVATEQEAVRAGTALRGLQRAAFVALMVTGLRYMDQPRWVAPLLSSAWLPALFYAGRLTGLLPPRRPRWSALMLASCLALYAVSVLVERLVRNSGQSQWPAALMVLLTPAWIGMLRGVSDWSGDPVLIGRSRRVLREACCVWVVSAVSACLAVVISSTTSGDWALGPLAVLALATFALHIRLWNLTRETWETLGVTPSTFTDDPVQATVTERG